LQRAIEYEIDRQIAAIESGQRVIQETRLWNERESRTSLMRSKEEAHDYRYFPEPDLPPLTVNDSLLERIRAGLPELPEARRLRFCDKYGLSFDDSAQLTDVKAMADYFEASAAASGNPKAAANWILNEVVRELKTAGLEVDSSPVTGASLGEMIRMIDAGTISGKMAKDVLIEMFKSGRPPKDVVSEMGAQLSDEGEIAALVDKVIDASPKQTEQYLAGKSTLLGYFVGQVMKLSEGRANPAFVNKIVKGALEARGQKNP
jgi:aspartyl-tRNA(Asn)/glutamyl-tRNA(Gln) amidotransferase subunit B